MTASAGRTGAARVLLVDDHSMVRFGLRSLIENTPEMDVCGEAANSSEAIAAVEKLRPDIAIVDISLGGDDGLELIGQLHARWPQTSVLALSMHSETLYAERAVKAGAKGYVGKHQPPTEVLQALRSVLSGGIYVTDAVKDRLVGRLASGFGSNESLGLEALTDRELAVLSLIGSGRATTEIARELHLSVKTVNAHRDHIRNKLGIGSARELIHYATLWLRQESGGAADDIG
jgi:DNA-binding NarL/FixJ family response regulator